MCARARVCVCVCVSVCGVGVPIGTGVCVCARARARARRYTSITARFLSYCSTDNAIKNRWNSTLKRLLHQAKERIMKMQDESGVSGAIAMLTDMGTRAKPNTSGDEEAQRLQCECPYMCSLVCAVPAHWLL